MTDHNINPEDASTYPKEVLIAMLKESVTALLDLAGFVVALTNTVTLHKEGPLSVDENTLDIQAKFLGAFAEGRMSPNDLADTLSEYTEMPRPSQHVEDDHEHVPHVTVLELDPTKDLHEQLKEKLLSPDLTPMMKEALDTFLSTGQADQAAAAMRDHIAKHHPDLKPEEE